MKFVKILFCVFCMCCIMATLWISAYATDLYPENTNPTGSDNPYYSEPASSPTEDFSLVETEPASSPVEEFNQDKTEPASSPVEEFNQDKTEPVKIIQEPVIVDTVAPITPSNTTGFQKVIMGLLGNYSPVVIEYAYTNSSGYISYIREVQPDYSWMCGAAIFLVVLYSLFRLIGALIKR